VAPARDHLAVQGLIARTTGYAPLDEAVSVTPIAVFGATGRIGSEVVAECR
jgi:hypothetical protein